MTWNIFQTIAILAANGFLCFLLCGLLSNRLSKDFLAAVRTSRSNHQGAPRQLGGLALVPCTFLITQLVLLISASWQAPGLWLVFALALAFLTGLTDDLKGLGVSARLLLQLAVAAALVIPLQSEFTWSITTVTLVMTFTLIATIYWINAVNFMDGLDWLLVSGLSIPLLFYALALAHAGAYGSGTGLIGLCAAGGLIGFAFWNRPPAKLFMGDSGSLFLGALSAAAILHVAQTFGILSALTPVLYFLVDSMSTIGLRLLRRENIFKAHSSHAYQLAFRSGDTAAGIALKVIAMNTWLLALSITMLLVNPAQQAGLFVLAVMSTAFFVYRLRKGRHL